MSKSKLRGHFTLKELQGEGRQLQGEGGLPDNGQEAADSSRHLDQRQALLLLRRPHQRRQAEEPAAQAPGEDPLPPGEPIARWFLGCI